MHIVCMQMRTAIIEKQIFFNIIYYGKLCIIIIMKMLSTYMFPWSRIIIISLNMSYCEYMSDGQTMLCVAGDFNAHIGVVEAVDEESIGRFGWRTRNRGG